MIVMVMKVSCTLSRGPGPGGDTVCRIALAFARPVTEAPSAEATVNAGPPQCVCMVGKCEHLERLRLVLERLSIDVRGEEVLACLFACCSSCLCWGRLSIAAYST